MNYSCYFLIKSCHNNDGRLSNSSKMMENWQTPQQSWNTVKLLNNDGALSNSFTIIKRCQTPQQWWYTVKLPRNDRALSIQNHQQ